MASTSWNLARIAKLSRYCPITEVMQLARVRHRPGALLTWMPSRAARMVAKVVGPTFRHRSIGTVRVLTLYLASSSAAASCSLGSGRETKMMLTPVWDQQGTCVLLLSGLSWPARMWRQLISPFSASRLLRALPMPSLAPVTTAHGPKVRGWMAGRR